MQLAKINQEPGNVGFIQAIKDFYKGIIDFKGRTTRAGYWFSMIWVFICYMLTIMFSVILFLSSINVTVTTDLATALSEHITSHLLFLVAVILIGIFGIALPSLTTMVRRYRDAGVSDYGIVLVIVLSLFFGSSQVMSQSIFISLISFAVAIFTFILTVVPTDYFVTKKENGLIKFLFRES